jgi:hypothetical protein
VERHDQEKNETATRQESTVLCWCVGHALQLNNVSAGIGSAPLQLVRNRLCSFD